MPDARLVEQILSALDSGVPAEVEAIARIVDATDAEVRQALAAVAAYRERVAAERDDRIARDADEAQVAPAGTQFGDFVVEGMLGRGAMGVVYRARQVSLGRSVALKVLPKSLVTRDPRFLARFRREATLAATIHHPHLAEVYGFAEAGHVVCFAMRLVDGPTLHEVLQRLAREQVAPVRPTSPGHVRQSVLLVRALADALALIHAHGLVHRDVKPANVLLECRDGEDALAAPPVLVDFGLLRPCGHSELTLTHTLLGTPAYASHESVLGEDVDARADVFSLGATLHDLLTLTPPATRDRATAGLPDARAINPSVDERLAAILAMTQQRDRSLRYEHGGALRDELDRYLRYEPIRALPVSAWGKLRLWVRRDKSRAARMGASLAVAILVLTGSLWFGVWAASLTGRASTARRLERAGDLLGAASAWHDLGSEPRASWVPWLADDLQRARAYREGSGALRRAVDRLRISGLADVEDRHPDLALAHGHLCGVLLGAEQHEFGDAARAFLLREAADDTPELRQRRALDTWADYLLVQTSPQLFPAELPPLLRSKLLRYPEPTLPTWQAAAAAYAAVRSVAAFADLIDVLHQELDRDSASLCLTGAYHIYQWLHFEHRRRSNEPFDGVDPRLLERWATVAETHAERDGLKWMDSVAMHLSWWERSPESPGASRGPLALSVRMRALVAEQAGKLRDEWRDGRDEILRVDATSADADDPHWRYLRASGRSVDKYTAALWMPRNSDDRDRTLIRRDAAIHEDPHTPSRLDLGPPRAPPRAALSGTLVSAAVRAGELVVDRDSDDGGYLRFDRPGSSQLRLRTLVPTGARRLELQVTHMIGVRAVLRDGGFVVFELAIPGHPPFEISSLAFNPSQFDPAAGTEPERDRAKFRALVPSLVLAGRDELDIVLAFRYGNTTYRVYSVELLWDVPR